jgi:hypothetical protein
MALPTNRTDSTGMIGTHAADHNAVNDQVNKGTVSRTTAITIGPVGSLADYICTGTNDDVVIQAANDALAATGGSIAVRRGTYNFSNAVTLSPYIRWIGERFMKSSTGGVMFKAAATLTNLFVAAGTANPTVNADLFHDIAFENIVFNGNGTTTNLFNFSNTDTIKFIDCRLIGATNSIKTVWNSASDPTASTVPGGLFINRSIISANSGIGIDLQYQTQCWLSDCWFSGTSVDTWINYQSSNKVHLTNCEFDSATQALKFQDTATFSCQDLTIADSTFSMSSGNKAWTELRTNASSQRVAITGFTILPGVTYDTLVNGQNIVLGSNTSYSQGNITGATTFNSYNGTTIYATLTGNVTATISNGSHKGEVLRLALTQDGTGSRTITWPSNFKKAGGSLTLSTAASATDIVTMQYNGTNWIEVSRSLNVS